jgi:perosamine synthetase
MSDSAIPFGKPMLDQSEIDAVVQVLSGTTLVHGPVTHDFEKAFAQRIGCRHAIAVSSCTAGLHLSLFGKGIGPGDEVIVPAMTHTATAHAVEYCGAKPVFVDVSAESGNMDISAVSSALGGKTAALMAVHYLGLPCDMDALAAALKPTQAFLIEDCALSIDATFGDAKTGTFGLSGCFSFYPVKHMTTIEGGMVTTNDDALAAMIAQRKAFGYDRMVGERKRPGIYDVVALGYNYRMNEVEAAVGLTQLRKLDEFQAARARNDAALREELAGIEEITVFPARLGRARSSHYCLNAVLPKDGSIFRDTVMQRLSKQGIGSSVHYPGPLPLMSYYRDRYGYRAGQFPVAEWLADQTISLPVGPHLTEDDARRVGRTFKEAIHMARR